MLCYATYVSKAQQQPKEHTMASRYELSADFTTGTDVAAVRYGSYGTIPTVVHGKVVKVTKTQVTVELNGRTERFVADYRTKGENTLTQYGQPKYSTYSFTLHLATDPKVAKIESDAASKRLVKDVQLAATTFAKQPKVSVEDAKELLAQLQQFIDSQK